ncbi:MAG: PepSY domain-containing protein [Muribaculaceae bacterium]|nr:PepSY domain-containing protein [Muribaculaceae bacterium]
MNTIHRIFFTIHRVSGTVIAVFFFMWFFTGLVLIYHGFPRLDRHKALELASPLPSVNPIPDSLPDGLKTLRLTTQYGQTVVEWGTRDTTVMEGAGGEVLREADFALAEAEARKWVKADVVKVDTLHERDQWIMYSRYTRELPIYKFYFNDGSQVYVGAESGRVLQATDRKSRFWAWIGAIPHKLYFPAIRKDVDVWKGWLLAGGLLCLIASLSGIYVGLYVWIRYRRKTGRWKNPFRKRILRLHFTLGLIFALPLVAWSISGVFSMQKVPKWLVSYKGDEYVSESKLWGRGMLPFDEYKLDYYTLQHAYPSMRSLDFGRIGKIPVCEVITPDSVLTLDARYKNPTPLFITPEEAESAVRALVGDEAAIKLEQMEDYDSHYFSLNGKAPLPVYKISVENDDGTLFYINPRDGDVTYLNRNKIARRFLFSGIHYLNLRPFAGHDTIWKLCLWIVCITGMVFCFTSVWLGVQYLGRKFGKYKILPHHEDKKS